jgi:hypothetical protein
MDEITLDDKTYVSSKRAAKITGYAKDYVGQLCREGRVEARLVGRNWYVLESSIREHRFGAPEDVVAKPEIAHSETIADAAAAFVSASTPQIAPMSSDVVSTGSNQETDSENAWKPSSYSPVEAPMLIPILKTEEKTPEVKPEINVLEKYTEKNENYGVFNEAPVHSTAIKEMQSAWHDWFVRTNELDVSKETLLENPEKPFEEAIVGTRLEEEATPITLEKVSEAIKERSEEKEQSFGEEEAVVLHRAPSNPAPIAAVAPIQPTRMQPPASHSSVYSRSELRRDVFTNQHRQEGTIIRERRVKRRKRPSLFIQVILIAVIIASIVVALIGSGKFDSYLSQQRFDYRALQYLGGESTVLNNNK